MRTRARRRDRHGPPPRGALARSRDRRRCSARAPTRSRRALPLRSRALPRTRGSLHGAVEPTDPLGKGTIRVRHSLAIWGFDVLFAWLCPDGRFGGERRLLGGAAFLAL